MNIFAHELDLILTAHKKTLSSLYTIRSRDVAIPPSAVDRLKETLHGQHSATLNAEQLTMLQERLSLTDEEMRRLRAALLAEHRPGLGDRRVQHAPALFARADPARGDARPRRRAHA